MTYFKLYCTIGRSIKQIGLLNLLQLHTNCYAVGLRLKYRIIGWKLWRENDKEIAHNHSIPAPSPLPLHSRVQVRLKIFSAQPLSSFLPQFQLTPSGLHLLCVHACSWNHKIVDCPMSTRCRLTLGKSWSLRYAAQSSLCTSVPGNSHL